VSDSSTRTPTNESRDAGEGDDGEHPPEPAGPADVVDSAGNPDPNDALAARLETLAEENRRLRSEHARLRRSRHRRTALGLVGLGLLCGLAALLVPGSRTVLFALAGTGLFAGLLTYYLAPERFLSAAVGRDVYAALAGNEAALAAELGLQDRRVYVPTDSVDPPAWLYVPQRDDYALPANEDFDSLFVVTEAERSRGVSLRPTGAPLHGEFERALADDPGGDIEVLADGFADALTDQFELVDRATPDVGPDGNRLSVAVTNSAYGSSERFDHPVASFLGVATACAVGRPVTVETSADGDRADAIVTCTWESEPT
jgi:hypothetical protein